MNPRVSTVQYLATGRTADYSPQNRSFYFSDVLTTPGFRST